FPFQSFYSLLVAILFIGISLLVALHPLKQGVHDLMVGSIVVRENAYHADTISLLSDPSKKIRAFTLTGLFLVLIIAGTFTGTKQDEPMRPVVDLLIRQKHVLEENTALRRIMPRIVLRGVPQPDGSLKEVRILELEATLLRPIFDDEDFRRQQVRTAVNLLVKNYPHVSTCNYIDAKIMTGYNIGIWYFYKRADYYFAPNGKEIGMGASARGKT
ncbi:MAG: hypothetical protein JNN05_07730, partial [Candidatus Omnitrophica bacterium]|nr:hypothetical protein [Candidatus Omnitrophota bacterium]